MVTSKSAKACEAIQSKVESVMNSVEVARLTTGEYDTVKQLKEELDQACLTGDLDEASRTEKLIFSIIKEGPPVSE